jgi:NAD(P)-dependent dehydrogenase (short-subunit alcohol dehydrogenase family)
VNTIAPGPVETEGTHANGMVGSNFLNGIVATTPLGRIGKRMMRRRWPCSSLRTKARG